MKVVNPLRHLSVSILVCCVFLRATAPAIAGLLGSMAIFDPYYQETPESEVLRFEPPFIEVVSGAETEWPCLKREGLVDASLDVGADFIEISFKSAGQFFAAYRNVLELAFERVPSIVISMANIVTATALDITQRDITFDANKVIVDFSHGPLFNSSSILRIDVATSDIPGDFNLDNVVDGFDFLQWQLGESPNPWGAADLAAWQANYGADGLLATLQVVPEPTAQLILVWSTTLWMCGRSRLSRQYLQST